MSTIFNISNKIKLSSITPLLLDIYTGSAAAYSLRSLSYNTTNVVRVREDAGNTEQDFTAEEVTDGTLEAFVGAGNNGYVATWYDQSGNSNDATQGTAASQPKIVSSGVLVTNNGFECWNYDGTDDNLTATLPAITGDMLMAGTEGTDIFGVSIGAGSYSLLADATLTNYPLNSVAHIIWDRSLSAEEKTAIKNYFDNKAYSQISFAAVTSFFRYWQERIELTSFPQLDVSSGTDFISAWRNCSSLTSFPLLDVSSGTDFNFTWRSCSSLTSFPLLDVSSGTSFTQAWQNCSSLTSFPQLDVSSGTDFSYAWRNCYSLTSFPQLDVSSGTIFTQAWLGCSSLTSFPENMFDSATATNFTLAFLNTNLSSQSIENIVVSIDTAGQSNGTLDITGGGNATTAAAKDAIDSLTAKGWTVTVPDGYVSPYLLDVFPGSAAAYSLRSLSSVTNNVVRVREDAGNTEQDFTAAEITDGTLLAFVGAGNNGYVTTWYDQSGNTNDATQSTAASQPKIVDAGVLVTENGKPAIDFDGVDDYLLNGFSTDLQQTYSEIAIAKNTGITTGSALLAHSDANSTIQGYLGVRSNGNNWGTFDGSQRIFGPSSGNLDLITRFGNGTTISNFVNSNAGVSYTSIQSTTPAAIGVINATTSAGWFEGFISELIIYDSDQSANRVGIEQNINNHYNIY